MYNNTINRKDKSSDFRPITTLAYYLREATVERDQAFSANVSLDLRADYLFCACRNDSLIVKATLMPSPSHKSYVPRCTEHGTLDHKLGSPVSILLHSHRIMSKSKCQGREPKRLLLLP